MGLISVSPVKVFTPRRCYIFMSAMTDISEKDVAALADVLRHFSDYRKKTKQTPLKKKRGGGKTHPGLKHLQNKDYDRIARRLLAQSWHGQKAVAGLFRMAVSIEDLLSLSITWRERWDLGRLLLSALCYTPLYRLEPELDKEGKAQPAYEIVATGQSVKNQLPNRTRLNEPFPFWRTPIDEWGNQLVRPSRPCPPHLEGNPIAVQQIERYESPWLHAVHKLEAIPYRINKEMLDLVIQLDKYPLTRIVPEQAKDYGKRRVQLDSEYRMNRLAPIDELFLADKNDFDKWEKEIEKIKKENKKRKRAKQELLEDPPQPERRLPEKSDDDLKRRHWHKRSILLEEEQARAKARRQQFEMELEEAKKLRDAECFYQRVSVDYRGRMYLPAEFSYQGSDFARSVIEFAVASPMLKEGFRYLFQHLSNMEGKTKGPVADRRDDIGKRLAPLTDIAFDPAGNFSEWSDADKPYCFLRACIELRNAAAPIIRVRMQQLKEQDLKQKESEKVWTDKMDALCDELPLEEVQGVPCLLSYLPVELDQSSSAFAHIAKMMDDKKLLEQSNHGEVWSDLYTGVADRIKRDGLDDAREKRKLVKVVAVPWAYGASTRTCGKALKKFRKEFPEQCPYLQTLTNDEVGDLAETVVYHLSAEFKTCVAYTNRVKQAVEVARNREGQDAIGWITPTGFPVWQQVHNRRSRQNLVWGGEKDRDLRAKPPTDTINWQSSRTKTPPNLVHSLDAAVLHAIQWAGQVSSTSVPGYAWRLMLPKGGEGADAERNRPHEPDYHIITIHDCCAVHASYAPELRDIFIETLGMIHSGFDPLNMFLSITEQSTFSRRNIDIDWIHKATEAIS